jgi:hypothetical protein
MYFCHHSINVTSIAHPPITKVVNSILLSSSLSMHTLLVSLWLQVPTTADFQPDVAAIERAIGPKTRAVITISPNNPTGAVYSEESLGQAPAPYLWFLYSRSLQSLKMLTAASPSQQMASSRYRQGARIKCPIGGHMRPLVPLALS